MITYPNCEENYNRTRLNDKNKFLIALIAVLILVVIIASIAGLQTPTTVKTASKTVEEPTFIQRNSEITSIRYAYPYYRNYYSYDYCSQWLTESYRISCR
jgi:hypothetical protein